MYSLYQSTVVNPASVNPHWQLARSPPQQQQQQTDPQRGYGNGQNMASQQASSTGASNTTGGRPASTSGQNTAGNSGVPSMTPQYTLNGAMPTGYAYSTPAGWITTPQQVPLTQPNMPPQMNAPYNAIFDPSQQVPPQQSTYAHPNAYESQAYFPQQSQPQAQQPQQTQAQQQQQQQQQATPQQGLDTVQQGNYNR